MALAVPAPQARAGRIRPPRAAVLWAVALAACAAVATSVALAFASDHLDEPGAHATALNWVTLAYILSGLVAWWRRPESRFGLLMVAAGFAVFVSSLSSANAAVPYTLGIAFDLLPAVLFLHVFLAFPTGRVGGRRARALVATGYAIAFGLQLVAMALDGFGPDNLLAVVAEPDASGTLQRVQLAAISAVALAGIGILLAHRREAARHGRAAPALLVDAFALGLVMIAILFTSAAFGWVSGQLPFETLRRATLFVIGLAPIAWLGALLHARLARSSVAELVVALQHDQAPAGVRDALARALRDPSLGLVYWLPEYATWADVDGRPVALEPETERRATTLLDRGGVHVAALQHDRSLEEEPELLAAVAAAAAIALENARLNVELRARMEELKGSRARLVEAGDSERRRLERNLHDGAQQRLVAVALQLRLLESRIRRDPEAAEALASTASREVILSLGELRELARGIHPAVLEHGLTSALDALAARSTVATTVSCDVPGRLPGAVELAAYFVASEALANVAKYSGATSAAVRLRRAGATAVVEVADDGVGGADPASGSGLRGLADRVEALDGRLRVVSPPGGGTVVTAELPCGT